MLLLSGALVTTALLTSPVAAQPAPDLMTTESILIDHLQRNALGFNPDTTRISAVQRPALQWVQYDVVDTERRDHTLHYFVHTDGRVLEPRLDARERLSTLAADEALVERPSALEADDLIGLLAAALSQGEVPVTADRADRARTTWAKPRFTPPTIDASPKRLHVTFWTMPQGRSTTAHLYDVVIKPGGKVTLKVKTAERRLNPDR